MDSSSTQASSASDLVERESLISSVHKRHCFVVMPYGQTSSERKWFKGWYEVVIKPAVTEAGFAPVLAAVEEDPSAINDDIRAHLAFDPMVVVDLGGAEPEDSPNPNVMYELGIRHAFGLPLVMMAWKEQSLPFDVSNQRVIMEERGILDQATNRERLVAFLNSARNGKFYRPMEAVGRHATIDSAFAHLGEGSLLGALAREVREMRSTLGAVALRGRRVPEGKKSRTVKNFIGKKELRQQLYLAFLQAGGQQIEWAGVLRKPLLDAAALEMAGWKEQEWLDYVSREGEKLRKLRGEEKGESKDILDDMKLIETDSSFANIGEEFLCKVKNALPQQPWPKGIHKLVAEQINSSLSRVREAIRVLIKRGELLPQIGGVIYVPKIKQDNDQLTEGDV